MLRCHRNALAASNTSCCPSPRLCRCYNQIACRGSFGSLLLGNGLGILHFGQVTTIKLIIAIAGRSTRVFWEKMRRWDVSVRVYFIGYGHPQQCVTTFEQKPKIRVIEHNALAYCTFTNSSVVQTVLRLLPRNELDWRQRYGQSVESACRL